MGGEHIDGRFDLPETGDILFEVQGYLRLRHDIAVGSPLPPHLNRYMDILIAHPELAEGGLRQAEAIEKDRIQ